MDLTQERVLNAQQAYPVLTTIPDPGSLQRGSLRSCVDLNPGGTVTAKTVLKYIFNINSQSASFYEVFQARGYKRDVQHHQRIVEFVNVWSVKFFKYRSRKIFFY